MWHARGPCKGVFEIFMRTLPDDLPRLMICLSWKALTNKTQKYGAKHAKKNVLGKIKIFLVIQNPQQWLARHVWDAAELIGCHTIHSVRGEPGLMGGEWSLH